MDDDAIRIDLRPSGYRVGTATGEIPDGVRVDANTQFYSPDGDEVRFEKDFAAWQHAAFAPRMFTFDSRSIYVFPGDMEYVILPYPATQTAEAKPPMT